MAVSDGDFVGAALIAVTATLWDSQAMCWLTAPGLGLGISRRLAHAMGGDLRCVGAGMGACFELDLPVAQP